MSRSVILEVVSIDSRDVYEIKPIELGNKLWRKRGQNFIIKMMLVSVGIGKIIEKKVNWEKISKGLSTVLGT